MNAADSDDPGPPAPSAGAARKRGSPRSARRRAREFALQALYGWLMAGGDARVIADRFKSASGYGQADEQYFQELLSGVIAAVDELRGRFVASIDRPIAELSPVEHSILLIATYELANRPEIPFRVVINEAIELAKSFGASEGYRYVNGVLDRLAGRMRASDAEAAPVSR